MQVLTLLRLSTAGMLLSKFTRKILIIQFSKQTSIKRKKLSESEAMSLPLLSEGHLAKIFLLPARANEARELI